MDGDFIHKVSSVKIAGSGKRKKEFNSKILKRILQCLEEGLHSHMLKRVSENEFEITFLDQKCNPAKENLKEPQWKSCYLSLFQDLDSLRGNKYLNDVKGCKQRCKSNLRKMVKEEILEQRIIKVSKAIYKTRLKVINIPSFEITRNHKRFESDQIPLPTSNIPVEKVTLTSCNNLQSDGDSNIMSHYLCLSDDNPENYQDLSSYLLEDSHCVKERNNVTSDVSNVVRSRTAVEDYMCEVEVKSQDCDGLSSNLLEDSYYVEERNLTGDVSNVVRSRTVIEDNMCEVEVKSGDCENCAAIYEESLLRNNDKMTSSADPFLPCVSDTDDFNIGFNDVYMSEALFSEASWNNTERYFF